MQTSRRRFLQGTTAAALGTLLTGPSQTQAREPGDQMVLGLVTYLWGRDWDLKTLIENCEKSNVLGVELRTTHAHGVEPSLSKKERQEVAARFAASPVTNVGIGSNERYDHPDPVKLAQAIKATKDFIVLSHDVGGTGVKVKPDSFQKDVPHEKTIEQIGRSLNELGEYGMGYGQQIRLEVHGGCAELPTIKAIMDVADHENVAVCWNCNAQDLQGEGLKHNFGLVRERFGATVHVRELDDTSYPYASLFELLVKTDYRGWILLEARTNPEDRVVALRQQLELFNDLVSRAQAKR